jgi:hypothetical protein
MNRDRLERDRRIHELDRQNREKFHRLFEEPDHAREVLVKSAVSRAADAQLSDNSTVDFAFEYFEAAVHPQRATGNKRGLLPTRQRLLLIAVADFVNALVLNESITVGPELKSIQYMDPLLSAARETVAAADERLSWPEIFAITSLAKAEATEAVSSDDQLLNIAEKVIGEHLVRSDVLHIVRNIHPRDSFPSIKDLTEQFYYSDFSYGVLGPTSAALDSVDPANAGRYRHDEHTSYYAKRDWLRLPPSEERPAFYAAHTIYRVFVYVLMADLLAVPYSSDLIRSDVVRHLAANRFGTRSRFGATVTSSLQKELQRRDDRINQVLGHEAFRARIPIVFKHILSRAANPREVLEVALDVRDLPSTRRFRRFCANVDDAIRDGDLETVSTAISQLSAYGLVLDEQLSQTTKSSVGIQALDSSKDLVSLGSPLLAALAPALKLGAVLLPKLIQRTRFAYLGELRRVPRSISDIEIEFANLWPTL